MHKATFRLVDSNWSNEVADAIRADHSALRIVCPFIKRRTAERLLSRGTPTPIEVITRFNLADVCAGVTDLPAIRLLLDNGAHIRGVQNLHAKVYIFGDTRVVVTSANLTESALLRNHEFGFVATDREILQKCRDYFDSLWRRAGPNLAPSRLANWEKKMSQYLATGARLVVPPGFGDEGVDLGITPETDRGPLSPLSPWAFDAERAFVKFLGEGDNRAERSMSVLEEVKRAGCHWTCAWPKGKRPRRVADGDVVFMGRLVKQPDDVIVFGRAIGVKHQEGRDDATPAEVQARSWKAKWPHYVRVHHAQFLAGSMSVGVSLGELMATLKAKAFASTKRNAALGVGNTNPRVAFRQQAAVELSEEGFRWLSIRLEKAFAEHGTIPKSVLDGLDWPKLAAPTV
jgi:hypothetical protein